MSTDITRIIDLARSTPAFWADQLGWEHGVDDDGEPCLVLPGWVTEEDGVETFDLEASSRAEALAPHRERHGGEAVDRTVWSDVRSWRRGLRLGPDGLTLEETRVDEDCETVTHEPEVPECVGGHPRFHDWRSDADLPETGVRGSGGGVLQTDICVRCGLVRVTDTWAHRPDTGEEGLVQTIYREYEVDIHALLDEQWEERVEDVDLLGADEDGDWTVAVVQTDLGWWGAHRRHQSPRTWHLGREDAMEDALLLLDQIEEEEEAAGIHEVPEGEVTS